MGERRLTYHAPVGISVGEPLDIAGVMGDASARYHSTMRGVSANVALCLHMPAPDAWALICGSVGHYVLQPCRPCFCYRLTVMRGTPQVGPKRRVVAIRCSQTRHSRRSRRSTSHWLLLWGMQACGRRAMACIPSHGRRDEVAASRACAGTRGRCCENICGCKVGGWRGQSKRLKPVFGISGYAEHVSGTTVVDIRLSVYTAEEQQSGAEQHVVWDATRVKLASQTACMHCRWH